MGALYRISRASVGFSLVLASAAAAQNPFLTTLDTVQSCGVPEIIFEESFEYLEQPLFGGSTLVIGSNGEPYWGTMMFTVNQENGFWTLFTFYAENIVCITASGVGFTPY